MSGYGQVQASQVAKSNNNKKIATIGISSLVLVAMVVAVTVGVNHSPDKADAKAAGTGEVQTTSKAVESICKPVDYKQACFDALSSAGNTSDPKVLVGVAFNATIKRITEAAKESTTLKELEKDPKAQRALSVCKQLMDYAVIDLQHSFERLGSLDLSKVDDLLGDLRIWLSAVVTYHDTCLDGFQNVTGNAGESMKKALNASSMLTSNALTMVTEFNTVLGSLDLTSIFHRRLLEEAPTAPAKKNYDTPKWVTTARTGIISKTPKPNVVVAQDGTGKYKTIGEALKEVPPQNAAPFVIHIKEGVYKEYVVVEKTMQFVTFVGDGPLKTKITGNRDYAGQGLEPFESATVSVFGDYFAAMEIGIENSAGPEGQRAVALLAQSDESIFYKVHINGYQNTLFAHSKRQFYRDCTITGTIDVVNGDAAAVFQNCKFVVRKPMDDQKCNVAAQGRTRQDEATGFIIQDSTITADPLLQADKALVSSYLARPWKSFSRTIIMNTEIGDFIAPEGYVPFFGTKGTDTCFFGEFNNTGLGADTSKRVHWKGIKKINAAHAQKYSAKVFIYGDLWIPTTGVPYSS